MRSNFVATKDVSKYRHSQHWSHHGVLCRRDTANLWHDLETHPFIGGVVLATGLAGSIDWACTSLTMDTATNQGLGAAAVGSVLAKYAPTQCK